MRRDEKNVMYYDFSVTLFLLSYVSGMAQSEIESKIQENKYYDCFLTEVMKVNNGYLLSCLVTIAPDNVETIWVVVPFHNMYYRGKRISAKKIIYYQGKYVSAYRTYSLSFKKYNQVPLGWKYNNNQTYYGDDYGEIVDVLFGKKIVSLQETLNIRSYYVTLDFGTRHQKSDSLARAKETLFSESMDSIQEVVNSFLYDFSYKNLSKDVCNFCKTNQINACFGKWGKQTYPRYLGPQVLPASRKFRYNWNGDRTYFRRIQNCQEMYGLPFISGDTSIYKVTIHDMQLLYWNDNLLTIKVQWSIRQHKTYSIVFSLKQTSNGWQVVGIARRLLNE